MIKDILLFCFYIFNYQTPDLCRFKTVGWGEELGFPKLQNEDWSEYTPHMLERCKQDVSCNLALYHHLQKLLKDFSATCVSTELASQRILNKMSEKGFYLDLRKAVVLLKRLEADTKPFENNMDKLFHPLLKPKLVNGKPVEFTPRKTKTGEISSVGLKKTFGPDFASIVGGPLVFVEPQPFNLQSPQQVVERLNKAGWKPVEKTKSGKSFKINQTNLATLPDTAPKELHALSKYLSDMDRLGTIRGWLSIVDTDSRLRGKVLSVGSNTHRMSHQDFQMANVPAVDAPWGREMRDALGVDGVDRRLVGADASGIQLRVLSHHMQDSKWQEALLSSDIHQYHADLVKVSRSVVKTFIYAWLLGASDWKIGQIIGGKTKDGTEFRKLFLAKIPGLGRAKAKARAAAERGYYVALDGRRIPIKSSHYALSVFLQGDEQAIMKRAMILLDKKLERARMDAFLVAVVHDEFQLDSSKTICHDVGKYAVESIKEAGIQLRCRCPLDGEYKVGMTWAETH